MMPAKENTPLTAAGGAWSSGLCSCFSDMSSCLTVCCLPSVALGQLSQKVLGHPCLFVTILLFSLFTLSDLFGLYDAFPDDKSSDYSNDKYVEWTNSIGCAVYHFNYDYESSARTETCFPHPFVLAFSAISLFAVCVVVATVRNTIRRRDKIEQGYWCTKDCGGFIKDGEDLCCAFWCAPCSICQMMRHEGMA